MSVEGTMWHGTRTSHIQWRAPGDASLMAMEEEDLVLMAGGDSQMGSAVGSCDPNVAGVRRGDSFTPRHNM